MATIRIPKDFKEFLQLLKNHEVKYLLIGGWAVSYHGYPRFTADMDIWIEASPENALKVVETLRDFGFTSTQISSSIFTTPHSIVRMGHPPLRLEITTSIDGIHFEDAYPRRIYDTLDGVEVCLLDLASLRANKRASGRPKDLDDLENLPEPEEA
jgi:predicted nucleotidyltransferase